MAQNGGRIEFQVGVKQDQSSFKQLRQSLEQLSRIKLADFQGSEQELKQLKSTANEVQQALTKAFNVNLNSVNVTKFNEQIKLTVGNVDKIYNQFSKAGAQGKVAFSQMAQSVLTTNLQLKETNSLLDSMGTTMVNTVKWGVASSVMNTFTSSVQSAFSYVESLEKSLTDIRIVTGDSTQKMEQFAVQANKAAQALGRSTMDYTKSALTFYQQGLNDETVAARTEAVLKAQNITGAGQEMADYLTSVWNGYKVANEEAELYVDKLAAVADSSASNMSQLAIAMSKVASTANIMGVDADQLNAQLATVIATTRQAPEAVGTAFKTIYTRLNDIKVGSEEAEVSLGNYSGAMANLGFNVLDAAGNLRDTGQVMEQIGESWGDLSREQQVFLARTMGGQRQITQVMALFDNWNTYTKLLNTSLQSEGTLMEKNGRYMESLGAKMEQLGAAGERVKNGLIDSDSFKAVIELLTSATNLLGNFIEGIGGGGNALLALGSIATQVFGKQIASEISAVVTNIKNAHDNAQVLKKDIETTETFGKSKGYQEKTIEQMVDAKKKIQQYYSVLSNEQIESYNNIVKQIGASKQQVLILEEQVKTAQKFTAAVQKAANEAGKELDSQLINITDHAQTLKEELDSIKGIGKLSQSSQAQSTIYRITEEISSLREAIGDQAVPAFKELDTIMEQPIQNSEDLERQLRAVRQLAGRIFNQVYSKNGLAISADQITQKYKQATAQLKLTKDSADEIAQKAKQVFDVKNITQMISSVGQLASGFNILSNMVNNVWTDKNLSAGEKALKTIIAMTTAIPMLINGYSTLQKSTEVLSGLLKARLFTTQASTTAITGQAAAEGALAGAQVAQAAATEGATAAQWSLNAALAANPIGMVIMAIGGLIAAFTALKKIYDHFTMSTEEATQAVENFKQKQESLSSNTGVFKQNVSNLQQLKKEYDELAKKAGASSFDSNIDALTEAERERYNQIKDTIVSYNDQVLVAYNDQHQAILTNNEALEETIRLLKEKHQEEINNTYGGQQYERAYKGKVKLYEEQKSKKYKAASSETYDQDVSALARQSSQILKSLQGDNDLYEKEINTLIEIQEKGAEYLWKWPDKLNKVYETVSKTAKKSGLSEKEKVDIEVIQDYLRQLQKLQNEYEKSVYDYIDFTENKSAIPISEILGRFQSNEYGTYTQLAQGWGKDLIDTIIISYVNGITKGEEGFTFQNYPDINDATLQIENSLLNILKFQLTSEDINQIKQVSQDFSKTAEGLTLENYHKTIVGIVQGLYNENNNLKKMADQNPETFSNLIASLFGLESIDVKFDDGKVEVLVDSMVDAYSKARDEAKEKIAKLNDISDENREVLNQYVDNANNYSLKNFDQLLDHMDLKAENFKQQIKETAEQLNNVSHLQMSTTAFDLINQRDNGGKLSEKQAGMLTEELDNLATIYPGLTEQIRILNEEELKGTAEYQKALFSLKSTIFETFAQVGDYSETALGEIANVIHSMDDLSTAITQNPSLFQNEDGKDTEWYREQLEKLAVQYQSCTDELNEYLRTGDEAARLQLQLAIRAEQSASKYGIASERISDLSQHFMELARAGQKGYQGLQNNSELATDAAIRYIRLNDSLADLYDNLDNYKKVQNELKDSSNDLADILGGQLGGAFRKIKQDVAGIADVDVSLLKDTWIADNMQLIMDAAEGGQDAIRRLQQAAAQQILLNLNIDYSALGRSAQEVAEWAANLPAGELSIDDTLFLQQLVTALQVTGQSREEIDSILSGIGINVKLDAYQEGLNKAIDDATNCGQAIVDQLSLNAKSVTSQDESSDTVQHVGFSTELQAHTEPGTVPVVEESSTEDGQPTYTVSQQPTEFTVYGYKAEPDKAQETQTKQNTAVALQVQGANKKAGGKISHYNTPGARKSRAAKSGNSSKKKSSPKKSSKRKTPRYSSRKTAAPKRKKSSTKKEKEKEEKQKDPQKLEKIEEEKDRYHDINIQITKIQTGLKNVQQQQKKLNGKDLSDNLNKQVEILKQQVGLYKQKIELAKGEQEQLKNTLRGYGVQFYTDGTIANYAEVLNKQLDEVNDTIEYYNSLSAQQQQNYKDDVDKAKERYEKLKDLIARYDKLYSEEIPGLEESVRSAIDKQVELQIENFKINVELDIDFSEATREWNKFKKQIIDQVRDDDIPGIVRSQIDDIFTYYPDSKDRMGLIPSLTNQVNDTLAQLQRMNSGQWSNIYGDNKAQALEDLKNYSSQLMKSLQDYDNLIKDIKKSFFDMVNQAQDAFDEQTKEYDFLSDLIDHDKKLIEMLYGEKAYSMISNYYQKQEEVDKRELQFQRQQKDFWYAQMQAQKARMDTLDKESNEYKEVEERFKELEEHWLSAVSDFNSKVEESISNLLDQYKNNVSIIFDDLNNKLTNGKGMDYINEEWELINENADMYLDKINSMYEIEKLQQAYEDAIADAGDDVSAQKSLNQMMNQQLKYLRQKDKLTQYDVDRANLLLQLETKRLALEQARQNKTKLRLRRDTQGNYTYQYVADENQTNQAQRGLSQVQNSLYNLDKNEYKNNLNTIYSLQDNFNNKMQELYNQYPIWTEQAERKRRLLVEQYGQAINSVVDQNEQIRLNLTESAFTQLAKMYDTDVTTFMNMSQTEKDELMYGLVPQWKSGIQQMAETFKGAGGFIPACKEGFVELDEATGDYQAKLDELEKTAGVNFENISNGIDTDITKTQKLLENNDALIDSYKSEMETVEGLIKKVEELSKAYTSAKQEAIAAAKAVQDYLDAQNKKKQSQTKTINAPDSTSSNNKTHIIDTTNTSSSSSSSTGSGSGKNTYRDSFKPKYSDTFKGTGYSDSWVGYSESFEKAISLEEGIAAAILLDGSKSGWDPQRHNKLIKRLDPTGANKVESYITKNSKEIIDAWKNKKDKLKLYYYSSPSFDTGGYTGSWGSSGKLGILHEKELVLNKRDTANLLSAVNVVRTMDDLLKGISGNVGSVNSFSSLAKMGGSKGLLDQNVHITATFPNVSSHGEIEKAFDNLINRASQYAFSKR